MAAKRFWELGTLAAFSWLLAAPAPPVCGDGITEGAEECDGSDLGQYAGKTCADLYFATSISGVPVNYLPANLGCRSCLIDRIACVPPRGCYFNNQGPKLPLIFCL